jgi:hypothetical protein
MKKLLITLIISGVYALGYAQSKDVRLWIGPVVKYNINERFRVEFEQEFRFNENISKYDYTFSEFALRYKVFNYLDMKTIYRHSFIPEGQTGSLLEEYDKSRISFNASTGTEIFETGIKVGYRLMYQHSWENTTKIVTNYLRNRFEIEYNLSKLVDPYITYENYYRLDDKNEFRQNRYTFGLTWKVSDKLDIDSFYRYENEINVKNPESDIIIGIGVIYVIN